MWRLLVLLGVGVQPLVGQSRLLVVTGVGGDPEYRERFHGWSVQLVEAARDRWGLSEDAITYLGERPDVAPQTIDGRSTKQEVTAAITQLARDTRDGAVVFIVLIGHGSSRDTEPMFNLPGPDMSATEFGALLDRFSQQQVVFANLSSASGAFVERLSGPNRTIVTATKSEYEQNESIFGGFFVQAFGEDGADVDKDGRVSVLEAFTYATREVDRVYERDQRLRTEHALLDDNGDGVGSTEPDLDAGDGGRARFVFLGAGGTVGQAAAAAADPEVAELLRKKQDIERRLADLRQRKDEMEAEAYEAQLEELLVELAVTDRAIRDRTGGGTR